MPTFSTHAIETIESSRSLFSTDGQTGSGFFKRILRRGAMACAVAMVSMAATAGGAYLFIQDGGNFHAVEPDAVYRSAQLDSQTLEEVISRHGIRSVLNLRGHNPGQDWYDAEVATSAAQGVRHFSYGLSANVSPRMEQMQAVLKIIRDAPKPILIHCRAGADRTGLVSALYLAAQGRTPDQARSQLALKFGHAPFGTWSRTRAMDESLEYFLKTHL